MQARIDHYRLLRNPRLVLESFRTISPVDGSLVFEGPLSSKEEIERTLAEAKAGAAAWRKLDLGARCAWVARFVELAVEPSEAVSLELTMQIGRPISDGPGEIRGWLDRGHAMIDLAPQALRDMELEKKPGFTRFIRHEPLGVVLVLAPWNYPWLTAVNAIAPALIAGNTVVLKHSEQTPLVAARMAKAAADAGLPDGVFQVLILDHDGVRDVIGDSRIDFVAFTGSVEGGRAVQRAAAARFIGVGLELGGKDPAYVCEDVDVDLVAANLVEGAFYNAGQSCCAVERIYVHKPVYKQFVDAFVEHTKRLVLGDPRDDTTTLGPVVRKKSADAIQSQIDQATRAGAQALTGPHDFVETRRGPPYLAPTVLVDVDHSMAIMVEETFGPAIGIAQVSSDDDAVRRMNDSRYGLTASIWTPDAERASAIGDRVDTGTWFMNRCDYLDPELAWVGVKDSGRGCSLSSLGYRQLTRPKSFHLRHALG
ncbi:MAG: aldehyde dehydrogenase family protein [Myxococcota bacterium]